MPPVLSDDRLADVTVAIATYDDDPAVLTRVAEATLAEPLAEPLLVVDMSRGDAVRDALAGRPRVRYVAYPESAGLSDSRNRIVALTATRYVLFVDADAVPEPGWAAAIRHGFDEDGVAVVGARCLPAWPGRPPPLFDTEPARDLLGMLDLGASPLDVPRVMGTSFAIDRERLPSDPPFSLELGRAPGRGLVGSEEVAYCEAVRAAGWRVRYEPAAVVNHHLRPERARWRWMLRRARTAGVEARRHARALEPLPRRLGVRDYAFLAAVAPAYFAGRLLG